MPYPVIALIAALGLAGYYAFGTEASRWSKVTVAAVVLASLLIWRYRPQWLLVAQLLQAAAGIYVLVYLRVTRVAV
jgi:hypothetical protein